MDTYNLLMGAKMGDLIHSLIVPALLYKNTGKKSNFYILEACDKFETSFERSFEELKPLLEYQKYINKFEKYRNGIHQIDYDLNVFRFIGGIGKDHININFLRTLNNEKSISLPFNFKYIDAPILDQYSEYLIISRKPDRTEWNDFVASQYSHVMSQYDKKLFISFNGKDYDQFPLKDQVELLIIEDLFEFFKVINSCKLFIANCSGPLCFASGLNVNRIGEVGSWIVSNYCQDHIFTDRSEIFNPDGTIYTPQTKYLLRN